METTKIRLVRKFERPCPKVYASSHFRGKHNVVGIYVRGKRVGDRCVTCGARREQ